MIPGSESITAGGITEREALFLETLAETRSPVTAAHAAYECSSDKSARSMAHTVTRRLAARGIMLDYFESRNLPRKIARAVHQSLSASRTIPLANGGAIQVRDHDARLKGAKLGAQLAGLFPEPSELSETGSLPPTAGGPLQLHAHRHLHTGLESLTLDQLIKLKRKQAPSS